MRQPGPSPRSPVSSEDVLEVERNRHLRTTPGAPEAPLVGLALSGGGVRSATFGLGLLQALHSMRLFPHIDYLSTVSGGGYISGWLMACLRNGRPRAIETRGEEPREVRFLRAYASYLTPGLNPLMSESWARLATGLSQVVLNSSILVPFFIGPLYLPWLAAGAFWWLASLEHEYVLIAGVAAGLTLALAIMLANMSRRAPWLRPISARASPTSIWLLVVLPVLIAMGIGAVEMWTWAGRGAFRDLPSVLSFGTRAGIAYAAVWTVGLAADTLWQRLSARNAQGLIDAGGPTQAVTLVVTAAFAGAAGAAAVAVTINALFAWSQGATELWALALLSFPICVLGGFLVEQIHLALAGDQISTEAHEFWFRAAGIRLVMALSLTALGVVAFVGPRVFSWQWADLGGQGQLVLTTVWALLVALAKSSYTRISQGPLAARSWQVRWLAGAGAAGAVLMALVLVSTALHTSVPHVVPGAGSFRLCQAESRLREASGSSTAVGAGCPAGESPSVGQVLGGVATMLFVTALFATVVSWRVDLNRFSFQTFYRYRIVRCFLGSSRPRDPHPFTGFDPDDDLPLTDFTEPYAHGIRPYPIFNAAVNFIGGKNLGTRRSRSASFVFTPEYCGFEYRDDDDPPAELKAAAMRSAEDAASQQKADDLGRDTRRAFDAGVRRLSAYARTSDHASNPRSLTMGLAMATSGVEHRGVLGFVRSVFNVASGWRLRNPRFRSVWTNERARPSLNELIVNVFGLATDDRKWVYLSDGGDFENLGIYELVRRRCRFIVACDVSRDADVTFASLGNAIAKCRADFGVNISIDISRMQPVDAKGSRRADRHCAVGTILYPNELSRPGTLLYLKASLTGDEPADVMNYAAQHPAFPYDSDAGQFGDAEFESYRSLGFHIAREVFTTARSDEFGRLMPSELFELLQRRWVIPAPAPADATRAHSSALARIRTMLRTSEELRFLDEQMFAEMPALLGAASVGAEGRVPRAVNYWLPPSEIERRAGFYACAEILQLMQDVYLDLSLEKFHDHIDNRGWMNLFQRWAWSGMLAATWAVTGSTYDARFQRFCWLRLAFRPGVPSVAGLDSAFELPDPQLWRSWDHGTAPAATMMNAWQTSSGLSFWEAELVGKYLRGSRLAGQKLFPIYVTIESPRRSDGNPLRFNVGYLIGNIEISNGQAPCFLLRYIRIHHYLRKMGLAREALGALRRSLGDVEIEVPEPDLDSAVLDGRMSDEALPLPEALPRVRRIVASLP